MQRKKWKKHDDDADTTLDELTLLVQRGKRDGPKSLKTDLGDKRERLSIEVRTLYILSLRVEMFTYNFT